MKETLYYQIGYHEKEEVLIAIGTNKRLVDIARDAFLNNLERMEWKSEEGEIVVDVERKKPVAPKKEK